jgi:hypothetical protein
MANRNQPPRRALSPLKHQLINYARPYEVQGDPVVYEHKFTTGVAVQARARARARARVCVCVCVCVVVCVCVCVVASARLLCMCELVNVVGIAFTGQQNVPESHSDQGQPLKAQEAT